MIEEFVARLFKTRNAAQLAHWNETSGFRHKVLGEFYDELISKVDALVEARAALFDMPQEHPDKFAGKAQTALLEDARWLAENRKAITNDVPALENMLDGINELYLSTINKLERYK